MASAFPLTEVSLGGAAGSILNSDRWDLKIRKMFIYPEKVPGIVQLNEWLQSYSPSRHLVSFSSIRLTPLFFHAEADDRNVELLGHPSEYAHLTRGVLENDARAVVGELLQAVAHIHERGIAHGCLSLENIVAHNTSGSIVILRHVLPITTFVPTIKSTRLNLAAPEIKSSNPFSYPADIWSIGVILQQLLVPDKDLCTEDLEDFDLLSPHAAGLSGLAVGFLMQCLKSDPNDRPTLAELLAHPFTLVKSIETGVLEDNEDDAESEESESSDETSSSESSSSDASEESEEDEA